MLGGQPVRAAVDGQERDDGAVQVRKGDLVWIRAPRTAQLPAALIRLLAGGLLLGGLARVVSLIDVGQPGVLPTVQIVVEIVIPVVVLAPLPRALRSPDADR